MRHSTPRYGLITACTLGGLGVPAVSRAAPPPAPTEASVPVDRRPPRLSGPYLGLGLGPGVGMARVNGFSTDSPFAGAGGSLRFGQMVLPRFGLGLSINGHTGTASEDGARQALVQGALLVDFNFVPAPERATGLSLTASFGFGGGAVNEEGVEDRGGYGGAAFSARARYEFFPGAGRYRPTRAGGLGLGPEVGWVGFTPSAPGRPLSNTVSFGVCATFYFGE